MFWKMKSSQKVYVKYIKRFFDFTVSIIAICVLFPVFLLVAVLVRVKLGKPVIFTQSRPGLNEKIFKLYKFRTMTNKKDSKGELLSDEARLTKFGKKLRATSLDELPELFNILKGEMSLVGPLLVEYITLYNEEQKKRHNVRPGLTGWAQVNGRNCLGWDERFKKDIQYVHKISFLFDCKILLYTVKAVLKKEGISSDSSETMEDFKGNG